MAPALVGTPSGDCLVGTPTGDSLALVGTPFGDPLAGEPSPDFHLNQNMRRPLYGHSCWRLFHSHFLKLTNMIKGDMILDIQL